MQISNVTHRIAIVTLVAAHSNLNIRNTLQGANKLCLLHTNLIRRFISLQLVDVHSSTIENLISQRVSIVLSWFGVGSISGLWDQRLRSL